MWFLRTHSEPSMAQLARQHQDIVVGDVGDHHGRFGRRIAPADGLGNDLHDLRFKRLPAVGKAFLVRAFGTKFHNVIHGVPLRLMLRRILGA
ncbi:hypothetical protein RHE_CH01116 [Rhizobium etli CFN 42]|uniref:Uncharacterized protein n=1 Tax=Rhizobium etli (strain ATCC 51251 / DSM 11541 / JCM 21823 / NBRC 15573 / CFN 42) TaxID=347834 RepID=Q2KB63_RHIEC|nr:hypothetical protein RHE_CH01116 [Rhizobium etli CFN 42]